MASASPLFWTSSFPRAPALLPLPKSFERALVTFVRDPGDFYLLFDRRAAALEKVQEVIGGRGDDEHPRLCSGLGRRPPRRGAVCLARADCDGRLRRAQVAEGKFA